MVIRAYTANPDYTHAMVLKGYRDLTDETGKMMDKYTYLMDPNQGVFPFIRHDYLLTGDNSFDYMWADALTEI